MSYGSPVNPGTRMVSGTGKPRLVLIANAVIYQSAGTTAYTSTTVGESGSPTWTAIKVGMRISALVTTVDPNAFTWARITAIDGTNHILTVDAWTNGIPTNTQQFSVDGFVIDLPYCQELTETFAPDYLEHELYGGDKGTHWDTKFRGWKYICRLDYSRYVSGDVLIALRPALNVDTQSAMFLIPRKDQPSFNYPVRIISSIELARYGLTQGYRKFSLEFGAKENVPSWPMIFGYGMNYAQQYGTCL